MPMASLAAMTTSISPDCLALRDLEQEHPILPMGSPRIDVKPTWGLARGIFDTMCLQSHFEWRWAPFFSHTCIAW